MVVNIYQTALITFQRMLVVIVTVIRTSHITVENKTEPFTLYSNDKVFIFRFSYLNPVRQRTHSCTGQDIKNADERKYE